MRDESRAKNKSERNQVSRSLDKYMLEQTEVKDYEQLIKVLNTQLYSLLSPAATYYSEYGAENKGLQMKEIKAEPAVLDVALKIGGKDFFSTVIPVNDSMYSKLTTDNIIIFSKLKDITGGAVPESVSDSIGKALNINSYLRLAYMIDGHLYGTSVIALKEEPDHSVIKLLKTYTYFTSMSLKRVLAEQALKQSEQELKTITENMTDLITMTDAEGKFTFLSENHYELFGYKKEELLGRYAWEILYTEDMDRMAGVFSKSIAAGEGGRAENRVVRKDGTLIWVDTAGSVLYDNGQISGALFVSRDISDRKAAEQTILKQEKETRSLLKALHAILEYEDFEKAARRIFDVCCDLTGAVSGYVALMSEAGSENEVLFLEAGGLSCDVNPELPMPIRGLREVAYQQAAVVYENDFMKSQWFHFMPPGHVELQNVMFVPLTINSKVAGVIGLANKPTDFTEADARTVAPFGDVTALALSWAREKEKLKESEHNLQEAQRIARLGRWELDLKSSRLQWSPMVFEIFEIDSARFSATYEAFLAAIHPDDRERVSQAYTRSLAEKKPYSIEHRLLMKDGRVKWVHETCRTDYDDQGQPVRSVGIVQDITDRKQAEEKIRYISFHDKLTGLYNRHYLEEEMRRLDTERQLPISVIMADVNGLKLVNDTYGHSVGDKMLIIAADILKKSFRKEDIVARWGGDEFLILLPQTGEKELRRMCKRVKDLCRSTYVEDVPISMALGTSIKDSTKEGLAGALKEAENKMYKHKLAESRSARSDVLNTLLRTLGLKSLEEEEHIRNMQELALKIGEKLKLHDLELDRLKLLITLHDIGKINISEEILNKKGPLTAEEWEVMKNHPEIGYRIARATEDFAHVAEDILAHHECWNGTGYPLGLKEQEIPLLARITAAVDAYEVMTSGRAYKKAIPPEEAAAELKRCAGKQFDPELVKVFLSVLEK